MRRTNRITVRLSDEELAKLKRRKDDFRAFSLADAARECICQCCGSQMAAMAAKNQDNKESNKEKKENSIPPEKNAPARPRDFDIYFSQITDDESLRGMVEEFLNGELRKGVDLARKTDLREHFYNWLPKYRNILEMKAKQHTQAIVQNEAKAARESDSDALQRKCDADIYAANLPEALAEKERVLARLGKPWARKITN